MDITSWSYTDYLTTDYPCTYTTITVSMANDICVNEALIIPNLFV